MLTKTAFNKIYFSLAGYTWYFITVYKNADRNSTIFATVYNKVNLQLIYHLYII